MVELLALVLGLILTGYAGLLVVGLALVGTVGLVAGFAGGDLKAIGWSLLSLGVVAAFFLL